VGHALGQAYADQRGQQRLSVTFDDGDYEALPTPDVPGRPAEILGRRPYKDRLAAGPQGQWAADVMSIGYGELDGRAGGGLVQDFTFMGGSLGMAAGEAFIAAARAAIERGVRWSVSPPRAGRGCRKARSA
jgi:acetyl-CoA carboxylase carboxyl transferase subunit beta